MPAVEAQSHSREPRSEGATNHPEAPSSFHPSEIDGLVFFVESTHGLQVATCSSLDCFDAGENAPLNRQYCDTEIFPDGCLRRWVDQSTYRPARGFKPPEHISGRDFGQDDRDKPGVVLDCLNGHPCVRGGRGSVQERSLETEPKQEVGPIHEDFSIFLLARPIAQSSDFVYFGFAGTELTHLVKSNALKLRIDFRRPTVITARESISLDQWHLIEIHRDTHSKIRAYVDGWDATIGEPVLAGNMYFRFLLSVSRGRAMHGDVAALSIYRNKLDGPQRRQVRDYFAAIYDLELGDGSPPPALGASVELERGLLAHWRLETPEHAGPPARGPGWQPKPAQGGPTSIPGRIDRALSFSGGPAGLRSVGDHPELDQLFRFTVSAWARPDRERNGWQSIVDKRDHEEDGWDLYLTRDDRAFLRVDQHTVRGDTVLKAGRWHHLAGVYDGDQLRLYVDGRLDGSRWIGKKVSLGTEGPMWVGRSFRGHESSFVGAIDEVRVYGRALSAPEIQALANPPDTP